MIRVIPTMVSQARLLRAQVLVYKHGEAAAGSRGKGVPSRAKCMPRPYERNDLSACRGKSREMARTSRTGGESNKMRSQVETDARSCRTLQPG